MRKIIHVAALAAITIGAPLALQPAFAAADQTMPSACQINLYTGEIDCSGTPHGPDWDSDPDSYSTSLTSHHSHHKSSHKHTQLASGPNAYDDGAYVGGYN